jgi:hypothetical protein
MRKIYAIFLLGITLSLFASCKKGDNDPFLSLKSRKARMHGDWQISNFDYAERNTNSDGDYTDITETYDAGIISKITQQYFVQSGIATFDTVVTILTMADYSFDKSGTWTRTYNTTETWTDTQDLGGGAFSYDTIITVQQVAENGDWSFLGKLKGEFKNKERIIMNVLSNSVTQQITSHFTSISSLDTIATENVGDQTVNVSNFYSGENNTIIEIDRLKNKEMIVIEKRKNSGSLTIIPNQGISTASEDDTFYSESTLILVKK